MKQKENSISESFYSLKKQVLVYVTDHQHLSTSVFPYYVSASNLLSHVHNSSRFVSRVFM